MTERHTMQKDIIYSTLCAMANHPTAEDVYDNLHPIYPSISKATVYRVLNQMAQNGTIVKINIANGPDCFDHQTFSHYHARCACCGKVVDMPHLNFAIPAECLHFCEDMEITDFSLQFNGICNECKKERMSCDGQ